MFEALRFLPKLEQNRIYRELQNTLLPYFAADSYTDVEQLQLDFMLFKQDELFKEIIQAFSDKYNLNINQRIFNRNLHKRWKLCRVCKKPFLSTDLRNGSTTCYYVDYKRYRYSKGEFFKSTMNGYSECFMAYRSQAQLGHTEWAQKSNS